MDWRPRILQRPRRRVDTERTRRLKRGGELDPAHGCPLLPCCWPLLLLQIVSGGALQFAWAGSQTLISQLAEGEAEYLGRFSFFARIGTTVAPMIAGVAWDLGGAWPSYGLGFAWGVALTLVLLRAPEAPIAAGDGHDPVAQSRLQRRHGRPRC